MAMLARWKSGETSWALIAVTMSLLLNSGCRNRAQPDTDGNLKAGGEPEQYSATVVRLVEDGGRREMNITRETRSGEKRKEEWTEDGHNRALIWRADIGKAFLLDLDRRTYLEIDITAAPMPESRLDGSGPHNANRVKSAAELEPTDATVQAVDRYFDDAQPPVRVDTEVLSPSVIDGHSCVVYRHRAVFPDGHTETTTRFHASDLSGLVLRTEVGTDQNPARVITERRDIRVEVAPDAFIVPPDFKRVQNLAP
jgi:hypothetical protein